MASGTAVTLFSMSNTNWITSVIQPARAAIAAKILAYGLLFIMMNIAKNP